MNGKVMNKTTLAFALAIQLAAIGMLLAVRSGSAVEPEPFLSFNAETVDAMTVANDEGAVTLAKTDAGWQLPNGIPADASKVNEVVQKLADASGGWPVASQASTAERFEVTEDNHQRHVVLKSGEETVADVYLGTSPGYRKAHARLVDDDDVYAITFSNYEAGVKESDWLDKSLLRAEGSITAMQRVDAFALTKDDEGTWSAASGATLDQGKVETLAGRFTGLSVLGINEAALPDAPKAVYSLQDDSGTSTFSLYHLEEEDDYVATSDRVQGSYEVSSYIAEQMDVMVDALAPDQPAPVEDAQAADAEQSAQSPAPSAPPAPPTPHAQQTEQGEDAALR